MPHRLEDLCCFDHVRRVRISSLSLLTCGHTFISYSCMNLGESDANRLVFERELSPLASLFRRKNLC